MNFYLSIFISLGRFAEKVGLHSGTTLWCICARRSVAYDTDQLFLRSCLKFVYYNGKCAGGSGH
jgi:hypothetical protein